MKILVVANPPDVDRTFGGGVILWDFLEWFSKAGVEVHFLSASKYAARSTRGRFLPAAVPEGVREQLPGFVRLGGGKGWLSRSPRVFVDKILARARLRPLKSADAYHAYQILSPAHAAEIARALDNENYDVVIADYFWCAPILEAFTRPGIHKGVITHDIMHKRVSSLQSSGLTMDHSDLLIAREVPLLNLADFICVETPGDVEFLREQTPSARVFLMPRAMAPQAGKTQPEANTLLFVGSTAKPNVQGLEWFLENVWPRVLATCGEARLRVVGSVCQIVKGNYPNVEMLGRVWELAPAYHAASVCIVPLLSGSGFKTKVIEAFGFGKATVSTSVGAEGLDHFADPPLLIADGAEPFAAAVVSLLKEDALRRQYEARASAYVEKFHSPQAVYGPILDYLRNPRPCR